MTTRTSALALLMSALVLGAPALAQETAPETTQTDTGTTETPETTAPAEGAETEAPAEDPASDLDMGTPVAEEGEAGAGEPYVREEFGDWQIRCLNNPDGADPCQMYQLLSDSDGNPVSEIAMFPLPEGSQAAAGANIVAPLETFLPAQLTLSVDGGTPRKYPFTFCSGRSFSPFLSSGCLSRVGFDQAAIDQFKRGANATVILVPAVAPDETITLTISLAGFTAAYDAQTAPAPAE